MRMSVASWTTVQNHLPDGENGRPEGEWMDLWHHIEQRTWGKQYSQECSIRVPKAMEPTIHTIMHEHGLQLVTVRREHCDHRDDDVQMEWWECYMCDRKGIRTITSREIPRVKV